MQHRYNYWVVVDYDNTSALSQHESPTAHSISIWSSCVWPYHSHRHASTGTLYKTLKGCRLMS